MTAEWQLVLRKEYGDVVIKNFPTRRESKEKEGKDILIEVYKTKDRSSFQLSFRDAWVRMEKVDKVETLVSLEKEIAGYRRDICNELFSFNKGRL